MCVCIFISISCILLHEPHNLNAGWDVHASNWIPAGVVSDSHMTTSGLFLHALALTLAAMNVHGRGVCSSLNDPGEDLFRGRRDMHLL